MNFTETIIQAVKKAEAQESKLTSEILTLEGMSGNKTRHFFNNIINQETSYLEIGTWKGSTLISALYKNTPAYHIAIDNFTQFTGPRLEFHKNTRRLLDYDNRANFLDADCFAINPLDFGIKDINTYFYDGEHSYDSQYKAIAHYYNSLAKEFILIVDDYNWEEVQRGTMDALRDNNISIQYHKQIVADTTVIQGPSGPMTFGDKLGWWNGLLVAHCIKG